MFETIAVLIGIVGLISGLYMLYLELKKGDKIAAEHADAQRDDSGKMLDKEDGSPTWM